MYGKHQSNDCKTTNIAHTQFFYKPVWFKKTVKTTTKKTFHGLFIASPHTSICPSNHQQAYGCNPASGNPHRNPGPLFP